MKAFKYDWDTDQDEMIEIPDGWSCPLEPKSFDTAINCAQCGKPIRYGNSYTSLELETKGGESYWVCWPCHKREIERRQKSLTYQAFRRSVL